MNILKRRGIGLLLCLNAIAVYPFTGTTETLPQAEARLNSLFSGISSAKSETDKLSICDSIVQVLGNALQLPGSWDYPFSQLKFLGRITSSDQKLQVFTWNLPFRDGTNKFYGFLLYMPEKNSMRRVYKLVDCQAIPDNFTTSSVSPENWYGYLAYDIITEKYAGETIYTLLGYAPENYFVTHKIIDVLWFDQNQEPVFGKPVFQIKNRLQHHVLFQYSAKVQMHLSWNDKMNMIVCDHLSPSEPFYTGNFQYYGPDLSFDAFTFEKGVWKLIENVAVRNSDE